MTPDEAKGWRGFLRELLPRDILVWALVAPLAWLSWQVVANSSDVWKMLLSSPIGAAVLAAGLGIVCMVLVWLRNVDRAEVRTEQINAWVKQVADERQRDIEVYRLRELNLISEINKLNAREAALMKRIEELEGEQHRLRVALDKQGLDTGRGLP